MLPSKNTESHIISPTDMLTIYFILDEVGMALDAAPLGLIGFVLVLV